MASLELSPTSDPAEGVVEQGGHIIVGLRAADPANVRRNRAGCALDTGGEMAADDVVAGGT